MNESEIEIEVDVKGMASRKTSQQIFDYMYPAYPDLSVFRPLPAHIKEKLWKAQHPQPRHT